MNDDRIRARLSKGEMVWPSHEAIYYMADCYGPVFFDEYHQYYLDEDGKLVKYEEDGEEDGV